MIFQDKLSLRCLFGALFSSLLFIFYTPEVLPQHMHRGFLLTNTQ